MTRLSTALLILAASAAPALAQPVAAARETSLAAAQAAPSTVQNKAPEKTNNTACGAQPEASGPFCSGRRFNPKPVQSQVIPFQWGYWPAAQG